jgi:hypothetical protein
MPRFPARSGGLVLAFCLPIALGGCSSSGKDGRKPVHRVSGKVLFRDQPAVGALVVFIPANEPPEPVDPRPRGTVQADGTFKLTTYEPDDGAPVGDYTVVITWPSESRDEPEDKFLGRFADRQRSAIKFPIKAGKNELDSILLK